MISEHLAHFTRLPVGYHTWLWRQASLTYMLILMLWQRQAIFESKGDRLLSSGDIKIRIHVSVKHILQQTEGPLTNELNYRGSSSNLNSIASIKLELELDILRGF